MAFNVGQRVELIDKGLVGTVAFVGQTEFQEGDWVGLVLDEAKGKNNGTVKGKQYFTAQDKYGLFVRPQQIRAEEDSGKPKSALRQPSQLKKPTSSSRLSMAPSAGGKTPDKQRTPRGSPGAGMSPAISTEKLRTPAPRGGSSSNLKASPSSDKLRQQATATAAGSSASRTKVSPSTPAPGSKQTSPEKSPPQVTPPSNRKQSVAQQVAKITRETGAAGDEGILRGVPTNMTSSAELEYLKQESKDLAEKLETLRQKRSEDKQKLIDYERCKIQLQQLVEFKTKMVESHADLQRQLQTAQKDARDAVDARNEHAEEMGGLSEAMEMAALDKEMAEEKAEILQADLAASKDRITELEMDLEILKAEIDNAETGAGSGGTEKVGIQIKQLQTQNERLKEALVKMRDMNDTVSGEKTRLLKENESMKVQLNELSRQTDKAQLMNNQYEQQINDLKEQDLSSKVDAALGSEHMIEQLTSKNLSLEERVRELEENIEDLEAMKEMDAECLENSKDVEKDLRQELALADNRCKEVHFRLEETGKRIQDYESTILKFRQRTAELQEQVQDLKDQLLVEQARQSDTDVDDGNGNTTGTHHTQRSLQQSVESEVTRVEHQAAVQHIKYLRAFLPDNFAKAGGDNDSVLLLVVLDRLLAKTALLAQQLNQTYAHVPGGMRREHVVKTHKADQWSFVAKCNYYLMALTTCLHKFQSILRTCSVERLARLAQLQPDVATQERNLQQYLELLKTNRLDENTSLDGILKIINYLQNIYSVHMCTEPYDGIQYMHDVVTQLLAGTTAEASESNEVSLLMCDLGTFTDDIDQLAMRIKNTLNEHTDDSRTIVLNEQAQQRISDLFGSVERAATVLHSTCSAASTQVNMLPDVEGLSTERVLEMIQQGVEHMNGRAQADQSTTDMIKMTFGMILANVSNLADSIDKSEFDQPKPEKKVEIPPVLERAHIRKQDAVEAESLRWQMEKKETDMMQLKKQLRVRQEEISEMKVRMDMAEKRLHTTGKEGDDRLNHMTTRIEQLQNDLKKQQQKNEAAADTLNKELEATEKENADLKERLKMVSKKSLLQGISRELAGASTPGSPVQGNVMSQSFMAGNGHSGNQSQLLLKEMDELRMALSLSERSKARIAGESLSAQLRAMTPLNVPRRGASLADGAFLDLDKSTSLQHNELTQLMRDTNRLQKQFIEFTKRNRVIDLTARHKSKHSPTALLTERALEARQINEAWQQLSVRMSRYRASQLPGGRATTDFASHPSSYGAKVCASDISERNSVLVGRITLPAVGNLAQYDGQTLPLHITQTQLTMLHTAATTH